MTTDVREKEIIEAIADIVLDTGIIPSTTLTEAAAIGATTLKVASPTGYAQRGYTYWFDDTGERFAAIGAIDAGASTLTLDYSGYAALNLPAGLTYRHESGARIATNLMLHRPLAIGPMLQSGGPVVAIWPARARQGEFTFGSTRGVIKVHVQVHHSLQTFDAAPIDPEAYNQLQQEKSWTALSTILNALDRNRHLRSSYNAPGLHAQGLGDQKTNEFAESVWEPVVDNIDIPQAIGALEITVRARQFIREKAGQT